MLEKGPVRALGAMSGTSMDGVDAAVVVTDGRDILEFGETGYRAYSGPERDVLRRALGRTDAPEAAEVVENVHAELLSTFSQVELVGFHGQTLDHRPDRGTTFQAGNGQVLAEVLGVPVVWDFRSADMKMGGQGAPLAPFFHHACARHIGAREPLAFVNIGGVANITWIDPTIERPEADGALLAFDTGPGNAPLDDLLAARRGVRMDKDGALAAKGNVSQPVIDDMLARSYFHKLPPKSLDRGGFGFLTGEVAALSDADAAATLTAAVASAVVVGLEHCPTPPKRLLVTGGGRKNPVLMAMLAAGAGCPVLPVEDVGLDGDMLEAQAFAYLAVRVARGMATSCKSTTGVAAPVGGGQISWPGGVERKA